MFSAYLLYFLREKRGFFINKFSYISPIFAIVIKFAFYYFASKAFIPNGELFPESEKWNLLEFVIIGEMTLFIAIESMMVFTQHIRHLLEENTFEPMLLCQTPLSKSLFIMTLSTLSISLVTLIFQIFIFSFVFNFSYPIVSVFKVVALNVAFLPLFWAIGYFSAAILIATKKASGGIGIFMGFLGVLSGAYFPTTVFPHWFSKIISYVNPLHLLLSETRSILKNSTGEINISLLIFYSFVFGMTLLWCSIKIFNHSIVSYKKKGNPLILAR